MFPLPLRERARSIPHGPEISARPNPARYRQITPRFNFAEEVPAMRAREIFSASAPFVRSANAVASPNARKLSARGRKSHSENPTCQDLQSRMDYSWCALGKKRKNGSWSQKSLLFQDGYLAA